MPPAALIFGEIESALHDASSEKRLEVLRRVTDLFVGQVDQVTEEQIQLFDDVLSHLIKHIEERALVELSARVAPIPNAPIETIRALARHDNIDVSGPILTKSERLTDDDLVEIVTTKSQAHLARIAGRNSLTIKVTDALVDHGDSDVASELAQNSGARFSEISIAKLVMRSDGDDGLTELLGRRTDIPPHHFQNLLSQATATVRERLLTSAPPNQQDVIKSVLSRISAEIGPRELPPQRYLDAQRVMKAFSQDTDLVKVKIRQFAIQKRVAEVAAGLSILSAVPIDQVDRLFFVPSAFGLMAMCRSVLFDWGTAWTIVMISAAAETVQSDIDGLREQYEALSPSSAQRLLRFWQTRQKVSKLAAAKPSAQTVQ
jgi:hypothetical protein